MGTHEQWTEGDRASSRRAPRTRASVLVEFRAQPSQSRGHSLFPVEIAGLS